MKYKWIISTSKENYMKMDKSYKEYMEMLVVVNKDMAKSKAKQGKIRETIDNLEKEISKWANEVMGCLDNENAYGRDINTLESILEDFENGGTTPNEDDYIRWEKEIK